MKAEESLFIDDNLRNVKAAIDIGINSVQFENAAKLSDYLDEIGIKI